LFLVFDQRSPPKPVLYVMAAQQKSILHKLNKKHLICI